jgi:hypothetical protein
MNNNSEKLPCLVCGCQLAVRVARGRKSGKPFVMIICPADGRHFRGFVGGPGVCGPGSTGGGTFRRRPGGTQPGGGGRGGVGTPKK